MSLAGEGGGWRTHTDTVISSFQAWILQDRVSLCSWKEHVKCHIEELKWIISTSQLIKTSSIFSCEFSIEALGDSEILNWTISTIFFTILLSQGFFNVFYTNIFLFFVPPFLSSLSPKSPFLLISYAHESPPSLFSVTCAFCDVSEKNTQIAKQSDTNGKARIW